MLRRTLFLFCGYPVTLALFIVKTPISTQCAKQRHINTPVIDKHTCFLSLQRVLARGWQDEKEKGKRRWSEKETLVTKLYNEWEERQPGLTGDQLDPDLNTIFIHITELYFPRHPFIFVNLKGDTV